MSGNGRGAAPLFANEQPSPAMAMLIDRASAVRAFAEIYLGQRQLAHPSARSSENGITQRGSKWGHSGFTSSCRWLVAFNQVHIRLVRRLADAGKLIVIEIGLFDRAIVGRNLSEARKTRSKHRRSLKLRTDTVRVNNSSGIDSVI